MNRRQWLQRMSAGVVAACVASQVSTDWLPQAVQSKAATEYLRRAYNTFWTRYGQRPKAMVADAALYEAYGLECVAVERISGWSGGWRTTEPMGLMFRDVRVSRSAISTDGWHVTVVAGEQPERI